VENKDVFSQETWAFQGIYPVVRSSVSIEYPENWDVKSRFFNMESIEPTISGDRRIWTMVNLLGVERQVFGPEEKDLRKWVAFDFIPPSGNQRKFHESWREMSAYRTSDYNDEGRVSKEMKTKFEELTSLAKSPLEIVKPLARFAQSVSLMDPL